MKSCWNDNLGHNYCTYWNIILKNKRQKEKRELKENKGQEDKKTRKKRKKRIEKIEEEHLAPKNKNRTEKKILKRVDRKRKR